VLQICSQEVRNVKVLKCVGFSDVMLTPSLMFIRYPQIHSEDFEGDVTWM
jgi:hypothetical protein